MTGNSSGLPALDAWNFLQMKRLYELCGSEKECANLLECSLDDWRDAWKAREPKPPKPMRMSKVAKAATKSSSSEIFLDPAQTKVAVFDIETSSLKSDFGVMICGVVKTFGMTEQHIFCVDIENVDLLAAEKDMIQSMNACLSKYDGVITYFGNRFDIPFIRTRALYHGIQPLPKTKSLDLYFTVKRTTNPSTRRLDRINQILKITHPEKSPDKTALGPKEWNGVVFSREPEALRYIVEHCVADVAILENAVNAFRDFVPDRIMRV